MLLFSTRYNDGMYEEYYEKISAPWRAKANGELILSGIDNGLRGLVASLYFILLVMLVVNQSPLLLRAVLVPLCAFVLVSVWRSTINWKRPYEVHDIDPLIKKDTQGKSMPSRHMTSAAIIACTLWWVASTTGNMVVWVLALLGSLACIAIAYVRIVGGVHFPRDIAVGAITAIVIALVGFIMIP